MADKPIDIDIQIDTGGCASAEPFALRVLGDSMSPEFEEGHIIIVDPAGVIQNGCFVVANLEEEGFILRQLLMQEDRLYLKPMRSSYETIEITSIEIIVGVVVQRAGPRRKHLKHYV